MEAPYLRSGRSPARFRVIAAALAAAVAQDICAKVEPAATAPLGAGHQVACHFPWVEGTAAAVA
jgi:hypothetical protein